MRLASLVKLKLAVAMLPHLAEISVSKSKTPWEVSAHIQNMDNTQAYLSQLGLVDSFGSLCMIMTCKFTIVHFHFGDFNQEKIKSLKHQWNIH